MANRNLSESEISALQSQGCSATNWSDVLVQDTFQADRVVNTRFSGKVSIGNLVGNVTFPGGLEKPSGLFNASIHGSSIGDNVYISNVSNLSNYDIESDVVIENVNTLAVKGKSSFGNGVEIEVFNEGGGREIKIFDRLSSQIAYLLAVYRHQSGMIDKLNGIVDAYVASCASTKGKLAKGCRITNCASIVNVAVGPSAVVDGAQVLEEGTIGSSPEDPAIVGHGVIANDFIILSGSRVQDAAVLSKTFVGQGVKIGKQYSAEGSAFFANCEGFHGEACSIFAGPYTVTHHKSTLMIAGLFSFYNAGSGTNQSNHMYKLGPLHQGALERGSKTGSFSYMLWPCHVGPFSVVMGKHGATFDTSNLPFSYINVEGSKSVITPAMNLFTVGTRRDSEKWPARDRRKDPNKLDLIHFDLLSPYIAGKVVKGAKELKTLYENTPKDQTEVNYNGGIIKRLMLRTCVKYYEMFTKIFLGQCIVDFLQEDKDASFDALKKKLVASVSSEGLEPWVDLSGLMAPARVVNAFTSEIESGNVSDIDDLSGRLNTIFGSYGSEKWTWFANLLSSRLGIDLSDLTQDHLKNILTDWKKNKIKLNNMILQDGTKEFDQSSRIGFGLAAIGDDDVRDRDFEAVRGTSESNKFIVGLKKESEQVAALAEELISRIA